MELKSERKLQRNKKENMNPHKDRSLLLSRARQIPHPTVQGKNKITRASALFNIIVLWVSTPAVFSTVAIGQIQTAQVNIHVGN